MRTSSLPVFYRQIVGGNRSFMLRPFLTLMGAQLANLKHFKLWRWQRTSAFKPNNSGVLGKRSLRQHRNEGRARKLWLIDPMRSIQNVQREPPPSSDEPKIPIWRNNIPEPPQSVGSNRSGPEMALRLLGVCARPDLEFPDCKSLPGQFVVINNGLE